MTTAEHDNAANKPVETGERRVILLNRLRKTLVKQERTCLSQSAPYNVVFAT
jgi:hypothetical protein